MWDRAIGIAGIGVGIISALALVVWPQMPRAVAVSGLGLGVGLLVFAAGMIAGGSRRHDIAVATAQPIKTSLRLQCYGDDRIPTLLLKENVYHWFTLYSASREVTLVNDQQQALLTTGMPKTWTILMLFERPALYSETKVLFSGAAPLPPYEVKSHTDRHVLVHFMADLPAGELEIYLVPAAV
jgi:hypothetical protein